MTVLAQFFDLAAAFENECDESTASAFHDFLEENLGSEHEGDGRSLVVGLRWCILKNVWPIATGDSRFRFRELDVPVCLRGWRSQFEPQQLRAFSIALLGDSILKAQAEMEGLGK